MNLYEKIQTTEPGRHAVAIGEALYIHSHKMDKDEVNKLTQARTYLESLALAELEDGLEPWMRQLLKKKTKEAEKGLRSSPVVPEEESGGS